MVKTVLWHGVRKWQVLAKQVTNCIIKVTGFAKTYYTHKRHKINVTMQASENQPNGHKLHLIINNEYLCFCIEYLISVRFPIKLCNKGVNCTLMV